MCVFQTVSSIKVCCLTCYEKTQSLNYDLLQLFQSTNICCPEMLQLYISPNLHADLVHVCTGLWLISNENQMLNRALEQIILEASLSDDIYRMPILMDIWTLYLRYEMEIAEYLIA